MNLYPQSMGMDGGEAGKLMMEDMGGLLLLAKEGIRLESMTGISVQGVSDIMALYGTGTSSLCVNGSVDMMGALTGLGGAVHTETMRRMQTPQRRGNLTGEVLRETLSWDLQSVRRASQ